ncbi:MAG: type II secretion system protein GspG [Candidatus Zixiibacteriota bacterium]|jgi:general secretion pathway protein G
MSDREILKCSRHPDRPAVARCVQCAEPLCAECARPSDGKFYCPEHVPGPEAEVRQVLRKTGRWRPALLVILAVVIGGSWGAMVLLRPAAEWAATYYQEELTRARLAEVADAADDFKDDMGRYPTQEEGLRALVEEPEDGAEWFGPYLGDAYLVDGVAVDVAGRPLSYRAREGEHVLVAVGADGKAGTADDEELRLEGRVANEKAQVFPNLRESLGT